MKNDLERAKLRRAILCYEGELHRTLDRLIECGGLEPTSTVNRKFLSEAANDIHATLRSNERDVRASW